MGTRIRADKQLQTAPGQGYVLHSDMNGELQFALLASLLPPTNDPSARGDIRSIDSLQLSGSILTLTYTDNTGAQFTRSCDLKSLAVDVKVAGAILQHPQANTYVLELTQTDGTTVSINLSDLLAVVTANSADIILSGNGTAASPLTATLSDEAKSAMTGTHWTDEFQWLSTGSAVVLSCTPLYPFPLHIYRNGMRQVEGVEWQYSPGDPKRIDLLGAPFGANGQSETVVVDYMTKEKTGPRRPPGGEIMK